jgi:hypothetical protein
MDGQNFKLPLGKSFWPLLAEERHEIERLSATNSYGGF